MLSPNPAGVKMKKFCNRITKQQWRVTVPNINSTLFRKNSPNLKDEDFKSAHNSIDRTSKRSSGSYDLQEAQLEYDKTRSLTNSIYVNDLDSSSESEEAFEDASSDKNSPDLKNYPENGDIYSDVVVCTTKIIESEKLNSQFEYDVPRISFKFFDSTKVAQEETYENSGVQSEQLEEVSPNYETIAVESQDNIKLLAVVPIKDEEPPKEESLTSETKEHHHVSLIKSGSDPNLALHLDSEDQEDENIYKVPRSLTKPNRLSQSLNNFDAETLQPISTSSAHSSIEHISCSQIIVPNFQEPQPLPEAIKPRKKITLRLKKPTILRKSKGAVDKWNNFRTKFNSIMAEHAAQQRVGAFDERDKITINFEEMYKNSKSKCKKVLENTSKMFHKKKGMLATGESVNSLGVKHELAPKFELTASDIEYKFETSGEVVVSEGDTSKESKEDLETSRDDFRIIKSAFRKSRLISEGQNGFEDLRRYIKQGGDFCKELSAILQERADAETQYAKSLSKLSSKLTRACRDGVGGLNEAWKTVAVELETRAEGHRVMGAALLEETAKPLRTMTESQHRVRKNSETAVDKAARLLSDWRANEAKGKKHSHTCARDNEKLQDAALLDATKYGKITLSRSTSLIQLAHMHNKNASDKDNAKLEGKKRKAEDAVKKADIEYYSLCVRAERARLEWESAVLRGVSTFQSLEEERLNVLKTVLSSYLQHNNDLGPRLIEATEKLKTPILEAEPSRDLSTFHNLRQSSQQVSEQLLPDFYCEHITLAMNRERRKQALVKLLHLIRQDIERERKSKNGLENLSKAIKQTPNFGAEDSQQSVTEKLYHMKSMLTYLEGARYKIQSALAEIDNRPRSVHPLTPHITITRDKTGLQQTVLKVPQWLREEWFEPDHSPVSEKSNKSNHSDNSDPHINDVNDIDDPDWTDRGAADGNSNQPDSDFDEFSSQCSSTGNGCTPEEHPVQPIARCKALYVYTPNLTDELALKPGDMLSVYRQQDDGWWLGECNGNVGIFPATYVEIIS